MSLILDKMNSTAGLGALGMAGLGASYVGAVYGMAETVAGLLLVICPFSYASPRCDQPGGLVHKGKDCINKGLAKVFISAVCFGSISVLGLGALSGKAVSVLNKNSS